MPDSESELDEDSETVEVKSELVMVIWLVKKDVEVTWLVDAPTLP